MRDETSLFLRYLLARCEPFHETACLTLTAMHPDGAHPCPSRHVPFDDLAAVNAAVEDLYAANALGWGGYVAVGLRRSDLGRWQRGGVVDVAALPALFVDVDDPSVEALKRLREFRPTPSCIVHSGGGYHAYWWLEAPPTKVGSLSPLLRALTVKLGGDALSVAHSLRLPGTVNTKPERGGVPCHLVDLREESYPLADFEPLVEKPLLAPVTVIQNSQPLHGASDQVLNPDLIAVVAAAFALQGYRRRGDWLNGMCLFPERHMHGDRHPSFGFNTCTGYGFCFVCGSMLLKDLCHVLGIQPAAYGGICCPNLEGGIPYG